MTTAKSMKARGEKMLPTQRQAFILDVLADQKVATLHQLADRLGASFSTVRRDLDELARKRLVERTHGGAALVPPSQGLMEDSSRSLSANMRAAKEAIGRMAAARIQEGDSVIFDSSTTVMEAARVIAASGLRITAVTNHLKIADLLAGAEGVRLIVPGGSKRPGTNMLAGEPGDSFLSHLHADIALIGAQSASGGMLTDSRIEGASSKRLLLSAVRTKILLIDSWKFGGPGFCDVVPLTEFDEILTDEGLSDEVRRDLERRGIFVQTEGAAPEKRSDASGDDRDAPQEVRPEV